MQRVARNPLHRNQSSSICLVLSQKPSHSVAFATLLTKPLRSIQTGTGGVLTNEMDAPAFLERTQLTDGSPIRVLSRETPGVELDILHAPPRVRLAQLARESAASCAVQPEVEQFVFHGDGPFRSHELLSVLIFSYGTGVYTLERILESMREDILYHSFIGRSLPDSNTLRAFRRKERPSVISGLTRFFELVAQSVSASAPEPPTSKSDRSRAATPKTADWLQALAERKEIPKEPDQLQKFVMERIQLATWTDQMLLDF